MKTLLFIFSLLLFTFFATQATVLTVTTNSATGAGSLSGIVAAATSGDTIVFDAVLNNSTITVTSTIDIDKDLTIVGPGVGLITLTTDVNTDAVFDVISGNTFNISAVTFDGTAAFSNGGVCYATNIVVANSPINGILNYNAGKLYLSNSTISNNSATNVGGGIRSTSSEILVVDSVRFEGNSSANEGGAIYAGFNGDTLLVNNCTFFNNAALFNAGSKDGGAIYYVGPYLEVINSVLDSNFASGEGGAIYSVAINTIISGCTFIDNEAGNKGAGLSVVGNIALPFELSITNSLFEENYATDGGALYVRRVNNASVNRCSFVYNEADDRGGAIFIEEGRIDIKNSTLSGNESNPSSPTPLQGGGAIYVYSGTPSITAIVALENSTVADNNTTGAGGGIFSSTLGLVSLGNTIVADNIATGAGDDISLLAGSSNFNTLGYNLIGDTTGIGTFVIDAADMYGNTASPIDPMLLPFGDFGDSTPTHALMCGSPAINAGDPAVTTPDQRGEARFGVPDIGAFEQQMNEAIPTVDLGPDINMGQIDTTLSAGTVTDSVNWYDGAGALLLADNNDYNLVASNGVTVIAEVTNQFGCVNTDTVIVDVRVGIDNVDLDAQIELYPNPTTGAITLQLSTFELSTLNITNTLGQLVHSQTITDAQTTIDLDVEAGIYFVSVQIGQGSLVRKLVVE